MRRYINLICFLLLLAFSHGAQALSEPEIERTLQEITSTHFSPFCAGRILSDCPTSATTQLKDSIREKLRAGKTKADIEQELYVLYGDEIRAMPSMRGV